MPTNLAQDRLESKAAYENRGLIFSLVFLGNCVSKANSHCTHVSVDFPMTSYSSECCWSSPLMKRINIIIIPLRHGLIAVLMLRPGLRRCRVLFHAERRHVFLASSVALWFSVIFSSKSPLNPPLPMVTELSDYPQSTLLPSAISFYSCPCGFCL